LRRFAGSRPCKITFWNIPHLQFLDVPWRSCRIYSLTVLQLVFRFLQNRMMFGYLIYYLLFSFVDMDVLWQILAHFGTFLLLNFA